MDDTTVQLILSRMDENHRDLSELKESISDIKAGIVGQVHCDAYRRDFDSKLADHTEQIRELKTICDGYQVTKPTLIGENELRDAKDDAIHQAGVKYDRLEARVENIEKYIQLVGFVWGNPAVKTLLIGSFLTMVGVYWGRIGQYGWHLVGAFLGAVLIVLVMTWLSRQKNREETKKTTKKLFGLKIFIVVALALPLCDAQEILPDAIVIGGPQPAILDPVVMGKATDEIDSLIVDTFDIMRFLSNDYWPVSLNNSTNITS
jgi:hypothetical protein